MKKIFEKWWDKNTKSFSIVNYRKSWQENGNKPRISFYHNGGKRINGDRCFDANLIIGYTIFSYTNWDLQKRRYRCKKDGTKMKNYDFQFVSDSGEITYVCASCRKEAINAYCNDKGVSVDWVKRHVIVRNMGVL